MNNLIAIYPQPLKLKGQSQVRSCNIQLKSLSNVTERELWYELPDSIQLPDDDNCDAYLLATLLPAMKLKYDIRVHGNVSRELLTNLNELQLIWSKWCPETYNIIKIEVDSIVVRNQKTEGTVLAFSGGIDATFTAYKHTKDSSIYSYQPIEAGILIHGFGILLEDNIGFQDTAKKAQKTLNELNIPLLTVKTNATRVWNIHWGHYHGTAIASVLNNLNMKFNEGLISSGQSYESLPIAWGSSPITDPLFSTESFKIKHYGAGFNRIEKLRLLSNYPNGLSGLQVCYTIKQKDSNCGCCEKCIRTRLNLLLAGIDQSKYFDRPLMVDLLKKVKISSDGSYSSWILIYQTILETNIASEYLPAIKTIIRKHRLLRLRSKLAKPIKKHYKKFIYLTPV